MVGVWRRRKRKRSRARSRMGAEVRAAISTPPVDDAPKRSTNQEWLFVIAG
jgi:hypothetical protein